MTQHQDPPQQPWPNQPPAYGTPAPPAPPRKRKAPTWLIVTSAVIVGLCGIGTVAAIATSGTEVEQPAAAPATSDDTSAKAVPIQPEPAVEETTASPTPAEPELTASQEQAVGVALDYLRYTGFSRIGLIEQLEFEGFSAADAEFGVDYLDVDWMEQAVIMAEEYLEYSHFSRQGLIEQLEFEGFTREQAEHGVNEAGL